MYDFIYNHTFIFRIYESKLFSHEAMNDMKATLWDNLHKYSIERISILNQVILLYVPC